jgi:hypothetical protein
MTKIGITDQLRVGAVSAFSGGFALSVILAANLVMHGGHMDSASFILFVATLLVYSSVFFVFAVVGVFVAVRVAGRFADPSRRRVLAITLATYAVVSVVLVIGAMEAWELLFGVGPAALVVTAVAYAMLIRISVTALQSTH